MAWTIQHLAQTYTEDQITDWAVELHLAMPDHDWRVVERELFDTAATFAVPAAKVGDIADRLEDAALSVYMHPMHVRMTEDIAAAARTAADRREPWRWI
ncbi:hypothetical protein [Streptomyces sp. NPDC088910]|uniref:DUF7739 domain-containing protein n=1 Tax=Streptomyces sp. NPDC088910 TaxID=3365911 RepID=UPI00380CD1A1